MNELLSRSASKAVEAISALKQKSESTGKSIKDKTGVDLVSIVEKLSRRVSKTK